MMILTQRGEIDRRIQLEHVAIQNVAAWTCHSNELLVVVCGGCDGNGDGDDDHGGEQHCKVPHLATGWSSQKRSRCYLTFIVVGSVMMGIASEAVVARSDHRNVFHNNGKWI
jgi:hypothetical protein